MVSPHQIGAATRAWDGGKGAEGRRTTHRGVAGGQSHEVLALQGAAKTGSIQSMKQGIGRCVPSNARLSRNQGCTPTRTLEIVLDGGSSDES